MNQPVSIAEINPEDVNIPDGKSLGEWIDARVARYGTRKLDWDALGEAFLSLQHYGLDQARRGILLAVCSKNDEANALAPFDSHPEMALRRNERLVGAHFAIGVEDALFLRGELPLVALSEPELDRILGSVYAYVEQCFPALIRLGFASRFTAR